MPFTTEEKADTLTQGENPRILVVDDEDLIRRFVAGVLSSEGFRVNAAANVHEAKVLAEKQDFDLLITDIKMPGEDGRKLVQHLRTNSRPTGIMMMTAYPDARTVKFAEEWEVSSLLVKPFTVRQLKYTVLSAWESHKASYHGIETGNRDSRDNDLGLIGTSPFIKELRDKIRLLACGHFPVLIQGDSGTGKEVIAHALHNCSPRQELPIFTLNCAAIPHHLEESELFGHAKGAFTGAQTMKHGIVSSADKSTLFLDEIGELSLDIQAKLLRVVDTGEFKRIGDPFPRKVDIRIISATNRDLKDMVKEGIFRRDLYYRLKGVIIQTQSLSTHREDIPLLIKHFLERYEDKRTPRDITAEALSFLVNYPWPGNVRELKHTIHHLCTISMNRKRINMGAIRSVMNVEEDQGHYESSSYQEAKESVIRDFENQYFKSLLNKYQGNLSRASKAAGMHRPNLVKKLKKISMDPDDFRPAKNNAK